MFCYMIFVNVGDKGSLSAAEWMVEEVPASGSVGADPKLISIRKYNVISTIQITSNDKIIMGSSLLEFPTTKPLLTKTIV